MTTGFRFTKEELLEISEEKQESIRQAAIAFNQAFKEGKLKKFVDGEWIPVVHGEEPEDDKHS